MRLFILAITLSVGLMSSLFAQVSGYQGLRAIASAKMIASPVALITNFDESVATPPFFPAFNLSYAVSRRTVCFAEAMRAKHQTRVSLEIPRQLSGGLVYEYQRASMDVSQTGLTVGIQRTIQFDRGMIAPMGFYTSLAATGMFLTMSDSLLNLSGAKKSRALAVVEGGVGLRTIFLSRLVLDFGINFALPVSQLPPFMEYNRKYINYAGVKRSNWDVNRATYNLMFNQRVSQSYVGLGVLIF